MMPSSLIDLDPLIRILSNFNGLDSINFKKVLRLLCFVIVESKINSNINSTIINFIINFIIDSNLNAHTS